MNPSRNTRSSIFLLELMIAILFFSLGSAICIQVFVKAHTLNQSAQDLSFASTQVSSVASVVKYTDQTMTSLKKFYPLIQETEDGFIISYDKNRKECAAKDAYYQLMICPGTEESMQTSLLQIRNLENGSLIYELNLRYPLQITAGKESES
ncbi:MAG: hypothetical protein SO415_02630 [Oliverpabstia sp.]|nr:hypothetical protein [Oliverpabstia sp.]